MTIPGGAPETERSSISLATRRESLGNRLADFPYWLLAIILIAIWAGYMIYTHENFREAFQFIRIGIAITITTSLYAYAIAIVIGLVAGLGRVSRSPLLRNVSRLYVELIRGVPILVLIFYIALVAVPSSIDLFTGFGNWLTSLGLGAIGGPIASLSNQGISMNVRAIIALAVTYGAFQAEIFRAGIQSIGSGQMEAARSLGMSYGQAMRHVILPQAIRNVLPALGNDFIAMVKDSSLVSVLAVRDITQVARLYAGRTFRYREAYTTLAALYLIMTLILSFVVQLLERRLHRDSRK